MKNYRLLLAFVLLLALPACQKSGLPSTSKPTSHTTEDKTVRIATQTWPGYAVCNIGIAKGFFGDLKIDQRVMDDFSTRYPAFQSGQFDLLAGCSANIAFEYDQNVMGAGKVLVATDESSGGDGMLARPEIESLAQLRGKRIAYNRVGSLALLLRILEDAGLTYDDIQPLPVDDASIAGQMVLSGQADAACTWEPFLTQAEASGKAKIIRTTRDYPGLIIDTLTAHENFLKRPQIVKQFLRGWLRSAEYLRTHPEEGIDIIAKGLSMKREEVAAILPRMIIGGIDYNSEVFGTGNRSVARAIDYTTEKYAQRGLLTRRAPGDQLVSTLVTEVIDEMAKEQKSR